MLRIYQILLVLALLALSVLMVGCYTMVGYPAGAEEGVVEERTVTIPEREYGYSDYYYEEPYSSYLYSDYSYVPYYYRFLYPFYSSWNYSGWYYDDYYYHRDRGYNNYYAPQSKPASKKRGSVNLRRKLAPERRIKSGLGRYEKKEEQNRLVGPRRRSGGNQNAIRKRRASSASPERRSVERKSRKEEDKD